MNEKFGIKQNIDDINVKDVEGNNNYLIDVGTHREGAMRQAGWHRRIRNSILSQQISRDRI